MMETQAKKTEGSFFFKYSFQLITVLMALSFCVGDSQNRAIKHLVIQAWNIIYYLLHYSTSLPCVPPRYWM